METEASNKIGILYKNLEKALVEIDLPYPKGTKVIKEIIDMSENRVSFKLPLGEGFFSIGTPLENIKLRKKQKTLRATGEVVEVKRFKRKDFFTHLMG